MQPVSFPSVPSPSPDPTSPETSPYQSSLVQYHNGRPDIYQTVTERIVTALEAGVVPWVRPWTPASGGVVRNGSTQRPYHGINVLLLWLASLQQSYVSNEWYTVRQANTAGGYIRKGERGTLVTFWRTLTVPDKNASAEKPPGRQIPMLRYYVVFNREQIEGLPTIEPVAEEVAPVAERLDVIEQFAKHTGVMILEREAAVNPCYLPAVDCIEMPSFTRFTTREDYYAALLHELGHATGHPARLQRPMKGTFGTLSYAHEELVAELAAAFLCADFQLSGNLQHPEYINTWVKVLRDDNRAVFRAASEARKAAIYLHELTGAVIPSDDFGEDLSA